MADEALQGEVETRIEALGFAASDAVAVRIR